MLFLMFGMGCLRDKIESEAVDLFDTVEDDTVAADSGDPSKHCQNVFNAPEGHFLSYDSSTILVLSECTERYHAFAGGRGSTIQLQVVAQDPAGLEWRIEDLLGEGITEWVVESTVAKQEIILPRSGEYLLHVRNLGDEQEVVVDQNCLSDCSVEYTRYPIVFMHGLAGFDTLLNVFDYWVGVEAALSNAGFAVHIRGVSAFDDTYTRSVMWKEHLQELVETGQARKFNIIAHSQGGLDARYYASVLDQEDRVASITTISTPHHGSSVSALFSSAIELSPTDGAVLDALVSGAAELFGTSGASLSNQLSQMDPENMVAFNQAVPNVPDIAYFSWAGKSCRYLQWSCQNEMDGETVSSYFLLSHAYLEGVEGANDGLVSVNSAQWGEFLGVIPADHIDEVGHRFDLSNQPFDASTFYLQEAQRLSRLGL